jgi:hypothetical protein
MAINCPACASSRVVNAPRPGPISINVSSARGATSRTMRAITLSSARKFWPRLFFAPTIKSSDRRQVTGDRFKTSLYWFNLSLVTCHLSLSSGSL